MEKALPSVVFNMAKSGSGTDLVDVKVSADGQPLVSKLDGQAVPMNAGSHTFHFDGPDGSRCVDLPILVKEGERNQTVAVTLAAAPAAPTPSQSGDSPQNTANVPGSVAKLPDSAASAPDPIGSSNRWKTAGWAVGGAGVVGLGVATAFGVVAVSDKSAAHCDAHDVCDTEERPTASRRRRVRLGRRVDRRGRGSSRQEPRWCCSRRAAAIEPGRPR